MISVRIQGIAIPEESVGEFCRRHGVRRLALFGSILREDFGPDSDIDVLVEFQAGVRIGLMGLAGMAMELSQMLGRRVDLRTPQDLSSLFRDEVVRTARVLHAA